MGPSFSPCRLNPQQFKKQVDHLLADAESTFSVVILSQTCPSLRSFPFGLCHSEVQGPVVHITGFREENPVPVPSLYDAEIKLSVDWRFTQNQHVQCPASVGQILLNLHPRNSFPRRVSTFWRFKHLRDPPNMSSLTAVPLVRHRTRK